MYLQLIGALRILILRHQTDHHDLIGGRMFFKNSHGGGALHENNTFGKISENNSDIKNLHFSFQVDPPSKYSKRYILSKEKSR